MNFLTENYTVLCASLIISLDYTWKKWQIKLKDNNIIAALI
jgi:hypothetical protein